MERKTIERWHGALAMGTVVRVGTAGSSSDSSEEAFSAAMEAIYAVERACSRFDADSELSRLLQEPSGRWVGVGSILFQALRFACAVAEETDGRFDPALGDEMERLGFSRHYLTGESIKWGNAMTSGATFYDIEFDDTAQAVRLNRPMVIDLGAVAKGLGVDLAVQALRPFDFTGFVVDAGGDLFAAGQNGHQGPWEVGIRHPRDPNQVLGTLLVSEVAVCTSGTYERISPVHPNRHHLVDGQLGESPLSGLVSITAVGPYAMLADAFSTAAFFYPPEQGLELLQSVGLEGMLVSESLRCVMTPEWGRYANER